MKHSRLILPRALLLDMDGTLTEPMLDFAAIRSEMGIGDGEPILEAMAHLRGRSLTAAKTVLHRHENRAARAATLSRGCRPLLNWLARHDIRTAIITRNSRRSARIVLRLHDLTLDAVISRDDGPFKPDPESVMVACRALSVDPADVWLVGDGRHDIEAGVAAGIKTVWLSLGRKQNFAAKPWKAVRDLAGLLKLLRRCGD
jgi:HAD superfamily hydrolase (TIGR01549 family)